jgi:hypothetical protein
MVVDDEPFVLFAVWAVAPAFAEFKIPIRP